MTTDSENGFGYAATEYLPLNVLSAPSSSRLKTKGLQNLQNLQEIYAGKATE